MRNCIVSVHNGEKIAQNIKHINSVDLVLFKQKFSVSV